MLGLVSGLYALPINDKFIVAINSPGNLLERGAHGLRLLGNLPVPVEQHVVLGYIDAEELACLFKRDFLPAEFFRNLHAFPKTFCRFPVCFRNVTVNCPAGFRVILLIFQRDVLVFLRKPDLVVNKLFKVSCRRRAIRVALAGVFRDKNILPVGNIIGRGFLRNLFPAQGFRELYVFFENVYALL